MFRVYDISCEDGHVTRDVVVQTTTSDDEPRMPDCICGKPAKRMVCAPLFRFFKPVFDGMGWITNEAELKLARERTAKAQGCKVEDLVVHQESKTEMQTKADDHRHRSYARSKKQGLDASRLKEIKESCRKTGYNPHTGQQAPAPKPAS